MSKEKRVKAALMTAAAIFGAIAGHAWFPEAMRAWASVLMAGTSSLLAYLLDPK